ncbi:hypothetical protein DL98DRAFT_434005, partial [Cadophora sp. DSE1049]
VKNKLRGNANYYFTKDFKIIYITGQVGRDALFLIALKLDTANAHVYDAIAELYKHLNALYNNPNKERNARKVFEKLII